MVFPFLDTGILQGKLLLCVCLRDRKSSEKSQRYILKLPYFFTIEPTLQQQEFGNNAAHKNNTLDAYLVQCTNTFFRAGCAEGTLQK